MQNKVFSSKTLNIKGRLIQLDTPRIMGILNVTPDSFYDGGNFNTQKAILNQVEKMISEGADFIDVGGYSSRPGAKDLSVDEEIARVIPVVKAINKSLPDCLISVDTFRAEVAKQAIDVGAVMVNDISGGSLDDSMFEVIASNRVPYILMHMRGTPQSMTSHVDYDNIIKDIIDYFQIKIKQLRERGIIDVILDPGIGFAKTIDQNFELLKHLDHFQILDHCLL